MTRVCRTCKVKRPITDFTRRLDKRNGTMVPIYHCKPCQVVRLREYRFKKRYGITVEDYDRMYREQDGKCAICDDPKPYMTHGGLYVDHHHATNRARRLLCCLCNLIVGYLENHGDRFALAQAYLARYEGLS